MSSLPSVSEGAGSAFDRLHPKIQQWIWRRGWHELRPVQVATVAPILADDRDVVISAATAAGKTEAAFLPICSSILGRPPDSGVSVLYISPLKALINDQHGRLEDICAELDVKVHRWHGDVASSKKAKLLKAPSGILLITPESLEALFVIHGNSTRGLLNAITYVVVDELHAFIGSERGAQLQSLLHRVELCVRRRVPRVALSATLSDLGLAAEFLRPGLGAEATLISEEDEGQELRLQIRGYRITPPRLGSKDSLRAAEAGIEPTAEDVTSGDKLAIAQHLFKILRGEDHLVFANRRSDVETYADLLSGLAERARVPNEFFPHHGSLSKDLREHVEARLRGGEQPITAICTSTLELGIDIGEVESIAQVGAPPSVASLRQRLGRSGRRGGPAVLRIYIAEADLNDKTPPADWLRAELVQSVAMVRLLLERWIEPSAVEDLHLSTLVQQVLSLIAQHGGVTAADAHGALCGHGPFRLVTASMFAKLLRSLAAEKLILQSSEDTLLLDVVGERIVNHYTFYAAFTTPQEYRLVAEGRHLGSIPVDSPILPGSLLIFAGRRWRVLSVDDRHKVIDLARSAGGRPPHFGGGPRAVHDRVRAEMLTIYQDRVTPSFLDTAASELLEEGRDNFARLGLDKSSVVSSGKNTLIFPWIGDRVTGTIVALLAAGGLDVANDGIAITVDDLTPKDLAAELAVLLPGGPPDSLELAAKISNKESEKYDRYLGDDLLNAAYAARSLDPRGAWTILTRLADQLMKYPERAGYKSDH